MTVFEFCGDIIVIDCGVAFPDDEMLGVDLVIPDITYLLKNKEKVRAILLTHAHEDHIGALPYVLRELNVPLYGTKLTLGIVTNKLQEHGLDKSAKFNIIRPGARLKLGAFEVETIRVNHSVADCVAFAVKTPVGMVVHTGDFKIDTTPIDKDMIDLARFGELGKEGVLMLLSDSTNAERPGLAMSESKVGAAFDSIFKGCEDRIIITTFASNVHRVQQIIDAAQKYGRKVAVSGRSMENIMATAMELGYMHIPKGILVNLDDINKYPPEKMVIVTTGSQGEPMSALYRMAFSDHKKVEIRPGDLVIMSASAIPGNEKLVNKVINELYKRGANVIHDTLHEVHVSGHACQEELKVMLRMISPRYFMPIHGEYRHLRRHALLAQSVGIDEKNIVIADIGKVVELDGNSCKMTSSVPAGRVMVDGLGVGDVGNIVLRDRTRLSQDGLIIVVVTMDGTHPKVLAGPDLISRGFVYVREAEDLMEEAKETAKRALAECLDAGIYDWGTLKNKVKCAVSDFLYTKTKRKPMILPVIMEV
jgi:ribonuclease J